MVITYRLTGLLYQFWISQLLHIWFFASRPHIQVSQEASQVVWHSHLFKTFSLFVVIHTIKGFSIVNEAEIDVFLEFPCFLYDPMDVGNLSLYPLPFLNPACPSGSSWFMGCYSPAWRILSISLLACEISATVQLFEQLWHCPSLGSFKFPEVRKEIYLKSVM